MKDFRFFIMRVNVLKLYRDYMKILYKARDPYTRDEMVQMVKYEFLLYRDVENLGKVEFLIAEGRKKLAKTKSMIDMQA